MPSRTVAGPLAILTGSDHEVRQLDGRRLAVHLPPFQLSVTVEKEGMLYRETDAVRCVTLGNRGTSWWQ